MRPGDTPSAKFSVGQVGFDVQQDARLNHVLHGVRAGTGLRGGGDQGPDEGNGGPAGKQPRLLIQPTGCGVQVGQVTPKQAVKGLRAKPGAAARMSSTDTPI